MAPKDKVKRIMTPEQLEKLAMARVKAGEARAAMKEDADGAKMAILQKKMDAIQGKKKPTPKAQPEPEAPEPEPEPEPMEEEEPVSVPVVSEPVRVPVSVPVVSEPVKCDSPVKRVKKKGKKPVVIVENSSGSGSDSDDYSNMIYIRRKPKKRKRNQKFNKLHHPLV